VTTILVGADGRWVRDQVRAAFVGPGQEVVTVSRGQEVRAAVAEHEPDLVILDMQIGNMGGIAAATDLRLEESGGRLPHATILLLLDREADRFVAHRADADGMLLKPVDAGTLRRAAKQLLQPPPAPRTEAALAYAEGPTGADATADDAPATADADATAEDAGAATVPEEPVATDTGEPEAGNAVDTSA